MSFSERFKKAREQKSFSQQELANLLSVTDGTISNYEKGVAFPRWDKIVKLCDILNIDPNYLFWDDLSENTRAIITQSASCNVDEGVEMYKSLNDVGQAEIRGEMKQMLKSPKYNTTSIGAEIADDINKLMNMPTRISTK